ncbi:MAG: hypothetical protein QOK43_3018 [Acidimicrobiaceae bacterium]|nr:hypothetical protein [Acidimicrobiaceae bacterium]
MSVVTPSGAVVARVSGPRRPQSPVGGYVHGVVVLALLLAIATLALVVTPPSPPGIAEFAPRASETIDEALKQQASQFGSGEGGDCGAGQDCAAGAGTGVTTTTTTVPGLAPGTAPPKRVIEQARVKHCVGDPPRQTEDPQSPPCANYWEGDNGGSTSKGVTGDEIRVAYPVETGSDVFEKFVAFFNKRFQFFGRQIRGVPVKSTNREAYAVAADEEAHAFAALDFEQDINVYVSGEPFFRELARRKVVGVAGMTRRFTDSDINAMAPYYWQYEPSLDFLERQAAALVCRLHNAPASHAGAEFRLKPRRFAVLYERYPDGSTLPLKTLDDALARCGEKVPRYEIADATVNGRTGRGQDMRDKGITSVIVMAGPSTFTGEMEGYAQVSFEPELLTTGYSLPQHELQMQTFGDAGRRSHMFGVGQFNKLNAEADEPAFWAAKEANPDDDTIRGQAQGFFFYQWYYALLLLASGIQQAGPHLTPTTFAEGLEKTKFPNPGAGQAPYWQAHVGFGPGDHTMVDDVSAVWWNESAPAYRSPTNPRGGWCYIAQGARHTAFAWPADADDRFFDLSTCR